jgi:hypothetical protein
MMYNIFALSSGVVMEAFEDSALLLRLTDHHLIELNQTARDILVRTGGHRTVTQIAVDIAEIYQIHASEANQDIIAIYEQLLYEGIVERVNFTQNRKEGL